MTHAPLTAGNSRVKEARKLSRRSVRTERRLFLAEGWKALEAALAAGVVETVFATPQAQEQYADLLGPLAVQVVDDRAMASLSDAVSPQGVVVVCRFLDRPAADLLDTAAASGRDPLVVVAADVRDPGNAGTLLRTADAAGADAVLLAGSSVDAYNPKTVRATVGSLFHVPFAVEPDPHAAVRACRERGLRVLAAAGDGEVDLFEADDLLVGPTAWLFGNEAWGLPVDLADAADHRVRIPITGGAESLNLSTAAAVCLFSSARVRR